MLLLKQDIIKKRQIDKLLEFKLKFNIEEDNKYKIEAIQ